MRLRQLKIKRLTQFLAFVVVASTMQVTITQTASAHSVWLVPSHTSLSGEKPTSVTVDSSISNDIFHVDMAFGGEPKQQVSGRLARMNKLHKLMLTTPDGSSTQLEIVNFGRKSVAQVPLVKSGTYKIAMQGKPRVMIDYTDKDGKERTVLSESELPKDATKVKRFDIYGNVLSYVTYNDTTPITKLNTGKGLELAGSTHPNDLFAGETAQLQLLMDGKPAANIKVKLTQAGTRWRNSRDEVELTTDAGGNFTFTPKMAGMYLLEARKEVSVSKTHKISYGLSVSLEVLPE